MGMTSLAIPFPVSGFLDPPRPAGPGGTSSCILSWRPGFSRRVSAVQFDHFSDEELIQKARSESGPAAAASLEALFQRYYSKVAYWCLRVCGSREEAADLAQEVFLRVHSRLGSFRGESRFSTWLYQVTRSVAINHGEAARRRTAPLTDMENAPDPADPEPAADEILVRSQDIAGLRAVMEEVLEPLEARVLYLHYALGVTLPRITEMLELENRSGAKAYIVSGLRKLRRRLGTSAPRQLTLIRGGAQ